MKSRKGQGFALGGDIIPTLIAAIITLAVLAWLISLIFRITNDIDTNQDTKNAILYAAALMGDEQLVYDGNGRINRGVFDIEKLNALEGEGSCTALNRKFTESGLIFNDTETNRVITICPTTGSMRIFPVAIRYSDTEIHRGLMYVSVRR